MDLFIQIIGFVALFISIIAFQFKKHGHIVFCKMASEFIFSIQYVLLGAWTAAVLDCFSVIRNLLFCRLVKKNMSTLPVIIVFGCFVIATGFFTYDGIMSLLPIASKLLTTVSYVLMFWAIFRCFSRNTYKRYQENRRFLMLLDRIKDRQHRY